MRPIVVVETRPFQRFAAEVWSDAEREEFIDAVARDPFAGVIIPGAGGVRKLRWGCRGIGKSGGVRVIYYFHDERAPIFLLTIYGKNHKDTLGKAEENAMGRKRHIASEILEGLVDASAYLAGKRERGRATKVHVPAAVNVRAIRRRLKLSQPEFARRYALPLASLRKWEQGARKPDAATRAYLTLIARNPRIVAETLAAA